MPYPLRNRRIILPPLVTNNATGPALTPPVTSGLVLQLDANQGTSTTTNGASVASWTDAVGGNVFSQGTSGTRPTYVTSGQNGLPVLNFNGSQYLIAAGVVSALNTSAWTVLWVATTSTFSAARVLSNEDQAGFKGYGVGCNGSTQHRMFWGTGTVNDFINGGNTTGYQCVVASNDPTQTITATKQRLYVSGSAVDGLNDATSAQSTITPTVGTLSSTTNTLNWNGRIAEVLVYSRCLTPTEVTSDYNYLKTKWGTP